MWRRTSSTLAIKDKFSGQLTISHVDAWTDSSIVLSWLSTLHISEKVFVFNRISKIQQLLPNCKWSHVTSVENLAECESRSHELYWSGPSFLSNAPDKWPSDIPPLSVEEILEVKQASLLISLDQEQEWFDRFSSYQHMLRFIVWVRRFVSLSWE